MTDKRIQLLSPTEVEELYSYPQFTDEDRFYFFDIDKKMKSLMDALRTPKLKIYLLLVIGYFKAKSILYQIDLIKSKDDIAYIANQYFQNKITLKKHPSSKTITKIRRFAKNYFNVKSSKHRNKAIDVYLNNLVRKNSIPVYLFKELLNYLYRNHIPIPAYTRLQTHIGACIQNEENRLKQLVKIHIIKRADKAIEKLLVLDNGIYYISTIKADPKSFRAGHIKEEMEKYQKVYVIFTCAKRLIPKLDISVSNVNYYASLAMYYDVYNLRELPKLRYQLYILCFVYNQFQKINNNLIDAFIYYVRQENKKSDEDAIINIAKLNIATQGRSKKIADILELFDNQDLDNYQFKTVKKKAFKTMPIEEIRQALPVLRNEDINKERLIWEYHSNNHYSTAINIRPLFMTIYFEISKEALYLKEAERFLRNMFSSNTPFKKYKNSEIPTLFIDDEIKKHIFVDRCDKNSLNKIDAFRYEFLIYHKLEKAIRSGTVFSNNSVDYQSLNSDLKLVENKKEYQAFIQNSDIPVIKNDIRSILDELKVTLETLIERVNHRIISGENKFAKVKHVKNKPKITIAYEKINEELNDAFFDNHQQINIVDLLVCVDNLCQYSNEFFHIKEYQSKKVSDYEYLFACILANATGLGIYKLSKSSKLNYDKLKNINHSKIRLETLKGANKIICNKMAELPFFKHQNIGDEIHGSDDGQKFDVKWETFKSRYLRKYFMEKGVSAYSMIVNNIAVDTMIITGHESHYLFDIVYNNPTNIRPSIISTDTEGSNQVNFALLDLISVLFAPCYKTLSKKLESILGFEKPITYKAKDYVIRPKKKANEDLIIREWTNILNIYAALLYGDTSQNTIVKKLSSHERNNDTKKALWEYNNILMSIYLLLYVDSPDLRRRVRTALNRGEGFHQLRRAIANIGGGDFRGKNEMEIIVWNECARLVANAIIYYNAYLLSSILENKEKLGDKEALELLKRISPIAWQHINLSGMYDFSLKGMLDLEKLLSIMLKIFDEEWVKNNKQKS